MILSDKFIFCVQFQDRLIATASSRDWCAKLHFLDNHQPSGLVTHQDPLPQWSNIKLRYCQMPVFENSLGKSHLSSSEWPLWSFRTLIDRFNSFLETEGHSDHRKPTWSCDPKERYTLFFKRSDFFVTISRGECPSLWDSGKMCNCASGLVETGGHNVEQLPDGYLNRTSQCEMVQAVFVWPQWWSNTARE